MNSGIKIEKLHIGGMTCINCQHKIERKLQKAAGIQKAGVSYHKGIAVITYDSERISLQDIIQMIQTLDYQVLTGNRNQRLDTGSIIGLLLLIVSLYIFFEYFGILNLLVPGRLAETNMGYGMLFVIGLVTSVHCVAMCGGISLSQCIPRTGPGKEKSGLGALRPSFLYNLGRVISYTAVGFVVGALGSSITFSNTAQGVLKLIAGIFMMIMGINMLGIFPWLRRLNPRMPQIFARDIQKEKAKSNSPLMVGLLNGFMPCGPLQAMQIYALSTGSSVTGAISMLLFSLGTVPLMFGLGAISTALGNKFTKKTMSFGAVLVVVLGLSMLTQGWRISGFSLLTVRSSSSSSETAGGGSDTAALETADGAADAAARENGVQVVNSTLESYRYPDITVQAGTPVKWVIEAGEGSINGCNNRMLIDEYGIEHTFTEGENIIEFTPGEPGTVRYSCWMGMINATINVVEGNGTF